ncbi:F-box/kelch-repeat protein SKIP25-like, partial [Bidens hawaiensis]|uniref:F-box/kelch-repeat protein SKIP25-like n=1 Tax=Bidens hawaiensis TaxID=980011 RepID=UPI00404945FE
HPLIFNPVTKTWSTGPPLQKPRRWCAAVKLYIINGGKEGVVYDVNSDEWLPMPEGMVGDWRGPAAAMDEEVIYMVDELKGVLSKYDDVVDVWVDVMEVEMLKDDEGDKYDEEDEDEDVLGFLKFTKFI